MKIKQITMARKIAPFRTRMNSAEQEYKLTKIKHTNFLKKENNETEEASNIVMGMAYLTPVRLRMSSGLFRLSVAGSTLISRPQNSLQFM